MNTSPPRSSVQTQCKTCLKCVQVHFKHILNINPFPINMTSLTTVSNFLNSARPMFNKGTQLGNQIKSNLNKTVTFPYTDFPAYSDTVRSLLLQ